MNRLTASASVLGLGIVVTLGLLSCASGEVNQQLHAGAEADPSATSLAPIPSGTYFANPSLLTTTAYKSADVLLGAVVTYNTDLVAEDAALSTVRHEVPTSSMLSGTPQVALRDVTIGSHVASLGGTSPVSANNTPAWVIVYQDSPAQIYGPADAGGVDASQLTCSFLAIVAAATGDLLVQTQGCLPPTTSPSLSQTSSP